MQITWFIHLIMILVVMSVACGAVVWGHRVNDRTSASRKLGAALLMLWLLYNVYYLLPSNFAWERSLPLQVCDILALVAAGVLLHPFRIGRGILYFSAIPLTSQAVLTPTGNQNPAETRFWLYWALHAGIIACSLFDMSVNRYRPTFRDYLQVLAIDIGYVAIILPLDLALGWNYGYLAPASPEGRTIVDALGPWPERVFLMVALVGGLQFVMLSFWHFCHKIQNIKRTRKAT